MNVYVAGWYRLLWGACGLLNFRPAVERSATARPTGLFIQKELKPDSHIACRAHAVPLPCRAAKGLECVFPILFTQCGRVWFTFAMPCHAHAMLRPCSFQGHGTARPSIDGLWATCPRSASFGYHAEFHEGCYQTHTNLRCRWPVWNQTFFMDEEKSGSSTLQKRRSVKLLD
jgi:hypothetical protein